jgi:hypothetical protein
VLRRKILPIHRRTSYGTGATGGGALSEVSWFLTGVHLAEGRIEVHA